MLTNYNVTTVKQLVQTELKDATDYVTLIKNGGDFERFDFNTVLEVRKAINLSEEGEELKRIDQRVQNIVERYLEEKC